MTSSKKKFGLWTLTFLVIANMIGAGVFTTSGFTISSLGSPFLVVAAWLVGGLIAIAGAASYGQLARLIPESGGEYVFLSRVAHPLLGFIAGWVSLIAGFSGAIAFAATAFASYVVAEETRPLWLRDAVAVSVIVVAGYFHGLHRHVGAVMQNTLVILKLGLLAALLVFAATRITTHTWHTATLANFDKTGWPLVSAFAGALVWIALSYMGFNAAVYVADEADDATRTVPRALMLGTSATLVLYLLLNAVFVFAAPAEKIAGVPDVATVAADSLGGGSFANLVRLTISAALLTSVLSMMLAAPRVYAKMAEDGLMPRFLRFSGEAPWAATLVQVLIAVVLVLSSSLRGLLSYLGLTLSLSAACSVACLFLPAARRESSRVATLLLPAIYIVLTVAAAIIATVAEPRQLLGTALTFLVGAVLYFVVGGPSRGSVQSRNHRDDETA